MEKAGGGGSSSVNDASEALLQEAKNRLLQAERQHRRAAEREAAAENLESALKAGRADLSRREKAVRAAESRATSRERVAHALEEKLRLSISHAEGRRLAPAGAVAGVGARDSAARSEGGRNVSGLPSLCLLYTSPSPRD